MEDTTTQDVQKMRLSTYAKNKDQKQWYKDKIDYLDYRTNYSLNSDGYDSDSVSGTFGYGQRNWKENKINYDLFNNIINIQDFEYIVNPYGNEVGELPADFSNKDIVSGKIKVLLGMEMDRPFSWRIMAVNEDATTRREQEEFGRYREYVMQQIMQPIQQEIEMKYAEMMKGKQLSEQETRQMEEQMQQEIQAATPPETKLYMQRQHQDPAEVLASQILNYIVNEQDVERKFNKAWKHATLSAREIYWVGIMNDEPVLEVINPLNFDFDKSSDNDFIEDGEWAGVEMYMNPWEVVKYFGNELTGPQIDEIYSYNTAQPQDDWTFSGWHRESGKTRVLHRTWKALRKIGFLTYIDEKGEEQETLVDEKFKKDESLGHVKVDWEWIPETYEGYKINKDIYVRMRPVPSQKKNLDNLYECKLNYIGGVYDNLNSKPTSLMDRMRVYQYYYNIIMYRIEQLMASDKGKLMLLNINMIPKSSGIDLKQWMYYADAMKIGWMNPNEEGNREVDVTNAAKEIDMSLMSDIQKYIQLAEYMEKRCGDSIGVTKEMEGRIGQYQAVQNTEESINRSSLIVEPYFEYHNMIKRNVLTGLLDVAQIAYSYNNKRKLNYILDDFSRGMIEIDKDLLSASHYGLFVTNSLKVVKIKETITALSQAAMQNQTIDISDVISVLRTESIPEAEEKLKVGEEKKVEQQRAAENQRAENEAKAKESERDFTREEWQHDEDMVRIKEEERRETELQKQAILALGFAEDKDVNDNQVPDVIELAREGLDANIKIRKQDLEEKKFEQGKKEHEDKVDLEKKKLNKKPSS